MDTNEEIKQFIQEELISSQENVDLGDSDSLLEAGIIDSLGIMKILGFLEDEFSVEIGDDELVPENFESVDTISRLVDKKKVSTM